MAANSGGIKRLVVLLLHSFHSAYMLTTHFLFLFLRIQELEKSDSMFSKQQFFQNSPYKKG